MNFINIFQFKISPLRLHTLFLSACWLIAISLSLFWNFHNHNNQLSRIAYIAATSHYEKEVLFRRWIAMHGGIYAQISEIIRPNPYLSSEPERDILTPSGKMLTLINPAYMTRLVNNLVEENKPQAKGQVVSIKPIRPENIADQWEQEAIIAFQNGTKEIHSFIEKQGKKYLRFIKPLYIEPSCLKCHNDNQKLGDVRGALSFTLPLSPYMEASHDHTQAMISAHLFLCILGLFGIFLGARKIQILIAAKNSAESELQKSYDALEKTVASRTEELSRSCKILESEKLERQQAEAERILLETAIKQSEDCIIITDNSAKILFINPSFERITEYTMKEVLGQNISFFKCKEHDSLFYKSILDWTTSNKIWRGQISIITKHDKIMDMEASISPVVDKNNTITHYVGVMRDVTKWLEMKKQLHHSHRMEAIGTLAGGIAHDFRNILTVISGYAEMVLERLPKSSQEKANQDQVIKASDTATELVKQIMIFSCESEQELNPIQFQLIIPETIKLLQPALPANIDIRQYIEKDCNPVLANPSQLHRIIMNLCTNSIHAMKKEGGTLTIRLTQLKIGIENSLQSLNLKPGGYIHLEVKDTGHGMDKTTLNKIFTPYFTTKNKNEGTGLGLSVIHGLINSLGGNLTVFSELNKGAVFNIYLPTIESSSPQNTHIEQNILRGMEHILIVEDIDLILELERNMLENLGYRVTCFLNSIEAYEHFLKEPDSFDLVLTNLTMPFLNGTELAREIHDLQPDLPIILCTGFSEKLTDNLLQSLGVKDILKKPVIKKDLAKIIRKVLDERI